MHDDVTPSATTGVRVTENLFITLADVRLNLIGVEIGMTS